MFVVYAHRPGTAPAPVKGAGVSPFTAALAEQMVKPGASFHDVLGNTARIVMERTKGVQHPWLRDRLEGTLVLVPADTAVAAQTPPEPARSASQVPAEISVEPMDQPMRLTRDTNLRAGPDTGAAVLHIMRGGDEVRVTGRVRGANWLRVESRGETGYGHAPNFAAPGAPSDAPSGTPVAEAPKASPDEAAQGAPPAVPSPAPGTYTLVRATTMFAQPVLGARGIRALEPGVSVTVLDSVPDGNWVRVQDNVGDVGFITASALSASAGGPRASTSAPSAAPSFPVARGDLPPPDALSGALSGPNSSVEIAALPSGGGALPPPGADAASLAPPVQEAVLAGRDAAARAAAGGSSAAGLARQAEQRAQEAREKAQRAAELARSTARVHRFPNGDVYAGEWATVNASTRSGYAAKEGFGVYRFANGQVYEGEWRNDTMAGHGVLTFDNGDRYDGSFRGGLPHGNGLYRFANGVAYAGEVRQGRVEGYGELLFNNGDRYAGMVVDRLPSGHGELRQRGGARHVGLFRGGVQDGPGAVITDAGGMQGGYWHGATQLPP
jgi:SH3-like domain-containing protein